MTPDMIPSAALVLGWFALLRAMRTSGLTLALVGLVGTLGHELLHLAAGVVFRAQPTSLSIFPRREGDRWVLGSVGFQNITLWNAAPVAFAPLLLAGVAWLAFEHWTQPAFAAANYVSWLISGYVVACSLFACVPSSTDLRIGAASAVMYGLGAYLVWWATQ